MALQSDTIIYISDRKITSFKSIKLNQELASHHTLELVCRMDVLENLADELGASSKNFLGEVITIQIASSLSYEGYQKELQFKGVVTGTIAVKGHDLSSSDDVIITAKSPTYIADDGPHYASYNDVSLSEIIQTTFQGYNVSKLSLNIEPNNNTPLHYSVQHNESSFEYVKRLAAQYGEWFYYNGVELVFGKPDTTETSLTYGLDLKEYQLKLEPKSHNYKYYTEDYLSDEIHEKDSKEVNVNAGGYSDFVANKANEIYTKETQVWHQAYDDPQSKQRLDKSIDIQKRAIAIQQTSIEGVSDNPAIRLGSIVIIDGSEYRITAIEHTNNMEGDYLNAFKGVTANYDAYPLTDINAFPKSGTQTAIVKENSDINGLGRIKVQFLWQQKSNQTTPWLRVVTPHAGGDKGFHFTPEKGEKVLVGFENNNTEAPYILGSLYTGKAKPESWKTDKNDVKAIRTRSGHTIELNDAKGAEFISISDKNRNIIHIDTANNNITISAGENMTLNAKNMQINVEENLDVTVGKNKTESIAENSSITATNEEKQISETMKVVSSEYKQEAQEISTDASGEIITNAGGKITIASGDTIEYGE